MFVFSSTGLWYPRVYIVEKPKKLYNLIQSEKILYMAQCIEIEQDKRYPHVISIPNISGGDLHITFFEQFPPNRQGELLFECAIEDYARSFIGEKTRDLLYALASHDGKISYQTLLEEVIHLDAPENSPYAIKKVLKNANTFLGSYVEVNCHIVEDSGSYCLDKRREVDARRSRAEAMLAPCPQEPIDGKRQPSAQESLKVLEVFFTWQKQQKHSGDKISFITFLHLLRDYGIDMFNLAMRPESRFQALSWANNAISNAATIISGEDAFDAVTLKEQFLRNEEIFSQQSEVCRSLVDVKADRRHDMLRTLYVLNINETIVTQAISTLERVDRSFGVIGGPQLFDTLYPQS